MDVARPSARSRLTAALTVLGRNFIVSLVSALIALPVLSYLDGPAELAGAPVFISSSISNEVALFVRVGSVVLTIAFFLLAGRFGIPLYVKAFGVAPGVPRLLMVLVSPLIVIAIFKLFFAILLQGIQQDNFSKALLEYTNVTLWPFAVLPAVMGVLNGLRRPLPGDATLPEQIKRDFETTRRLAEKLPDAVDRAARMLDPALKGNYTGIALSAMSVTSIATAGISNNPVTFVLLFLLPATIAVGSSISFLVVRDFRSTMLRQSPSARCPRLRFALFSALLVPGLALISIGCVVLVAHLANVVYIDSAIPLTQFWQGLNEKPPQLLAYAIVLFIPLYWVIYFVSRDA